MEIIRPYIKQCLIAITKEGLKIVKRDDCKVCITYINLNAKNFESFVCEKPVVLGIDIILLYKILKPISRTETVMLYMLNDSDELKVDLYDSLKGQKKSYVLPTLELDEKISNIKEMEVDYVVGLQTLQFSSIIKDIDLLEGKTVEIKSVGNQLEFKCDDCMGGVKYQLVLNEIKEELDMDQKTAKANGEDLKTIKFSKSNDSIYQGYFSLNYMMFFIKTTHLCESMNILLKNDRPLVLEFFIADLGVMRVLLMEKIRE